MAQSHSTALLTPETKSDSTNTASPTTVDLAECSSTLESRIAFAKKELEMSERSYSQIQDRLSNSINNRRNLNSTISIHDRSIEDITREVQYVENKLSTLVAQLAEKQRYLDKALHNEDKSGIISAIERDISAIERDIAHFSLEKQYSQNRLSARWTHHVAMQGLLDKAINEDQLEQDSVDLESKKELVGMLKKRHQDIQAEQQRVAETNFLTPTKITFTINDHPFERLAEMCTSAVGIGTVKFCIGQISPAGVPWVAPFSYEEDRLIVGFAKNYSTDNNYFVLVTHNTKVMVKIEINMDQQRKVENFHIPSTSPPSFMFTSNIRLDDKSLHGQYFLAQEAKKGPGGQPLPQASDIDLTIQLNNKDARKDAPVPAKNHNPHSSPRWEPAYIPSHAIQSYSVPQSFGCTPHASSQPITAFSCAPSPEAPASSNRSDTSMGSRMETVGGKKEEKAYGTTTEPFAPRATIGRLRCSGRLFESCKEAERLTGKTKEKLEEIHSSKSSKVESISLSHEHINHGTYTRG